MNIHYAMPLGYLLDTVGDRALHFRALTNNEYSGGPLRTCTEAADNLRNKPLNEPFRGVRSTMKIKHDKLTGKVRCSR